MKKNLIITVLLTMLMSMVGVKALAHDIEVPNADGVTIYYNWANNNTELSVTYRGSYSNTYDNEYSGKVVIPASVLYEGNTYSVTSIGESTFFNCSDLTTVTIPYTVSSMGFNAFYLCSGLTSVHISDLAAWCNINFYYNDSNSNPLSYAHHLYLDGKEITDLVIPNGVTSIKKYAFYGCSGLNSVTIPGSISSIDNSAFTGCGLTSVKLHCAKVGDFWFGGLYIKEVTIGEEVTSIGNSAFFNCNDLTSVHISNLTAWCNIEFADLYSNPLYYAHHLYLDGKEITDLVIPEDVTSIGDLAFNGCRGLSNVTIGNSVTSIGDLAFNGCSGLSNVTIGNSVTSIGHSAFSYCKGMTSVTIGNNVTTVGDYSFNQCSGLTSVTIPSNVTSIGKSAFDGCNGLVSVTIPSSLTYIADGAFSGCSNLTCVNISDLAAWCNILCYSAPFHNAYHLYFNGSEITNLIIPNSVSSIRDFAFYGCSYLTSVTIPSNVTSIGSSAFRNCSGLTSLIIPNNVTSIGSSAFNGCNGLTSVSIPNSMTSIDVGTFYGCSSLTSVTIPNGVTTIYKSAFENCSSLTSVILPNSITTIGNSVFSGCTELLSVTSYITEPYSVYGIGFSENTYRKGTLYVPARTKELYVRFDGWREFLKIVEMADEEQTYLTILNGDEEITKLKVKQGENYTWQIPSTDDHKLTSLYFNDALVTNQLTQDGFYTTPAITTSSTLKMIYEDNAQKRGDVNRDGDVNVADHVELTKIIMEQE